MFNRKGEFSEEYRMNAYLMMARVYGLEIEVEQDRAWGRYSIRIFERLTNRRIMLCGAIKNTLHEVNSWAIQQINDYNSWR